MMKFLKEMYGRGGWYRRSVIAGIIITALMWVWGGFGITWYVTKWLSVFYHDALAQAPVYDHRLTYAVVASTFASIMAIILAFALIVLRLRDGGSLELAERVEALEAVVHRPAEEQVLAIGDDALGGRFRTWLAGRKGTMSALADAWVPREELVMNKLSAKPEALADEVQGRVLALVTRMARNGCKALRIGLDDELGNELVFNALHAVLANEPKITRYSFFVFQTKGEFKEMVRFKDGALEQPQSYPAAPAPVAAA